MAGIQNDVAFGNGFKLEPSAAEDISQMQGTVNDVSNINHTGDPEGVVAANPSSLSHDPVSGNIYYKQTGTGNTGWIRISSSTGKFSAVNVQVFTVSGTYTPTAGMVYAQIEQVGGGGAGGGAAITTGSNSAVGAGGGGGEYAIGVFNAATIGASKAVTIGAGGVGVSGNSPGGNGGTTSVGTLITALGGIGGSGSPASQPAISTVGGAGGTGGAGGSLRCPGSFGGSGHWSSSDQVGYGGSGGASRYSGGLISNSGTGNDGSTGIGYGCGGSGASNKNTNAARPGGNGSPGVVYITEYISV